MKEEYCAACEGHGVTDHECMIVTPTSSYRTHLCFACGASIHDRSLHMKFCPGKEEYNDFH